MDYETVRLRVKEFEIKGKEPFIKTQDGNNYIVSRVATRDRRFTDCALIFTATSKGIVTTYIIPYHEIEDVFTQ